MRRNGNNKRVLRSGNGRKSSSKRKFRRNNLPSRPKNYGPKRNGKKRKSNGRLVFLMIIALVAFVLGAGIGISLSFDDGSADDGPHFENVTKEMTTNLNKNNNSTVVYDSEVDDVDFNENQTSQINMPIKYGEE